MPVLKTSASDFTTYVRVNAASLPSTGSKSGSYVPVYTGAIGPIARASVSAAAASPSNTVVELWVPPPPPPITGSIYFKTVEDELGMGVSGWLTIEQQFVDSLSLGTGDFTIEWWQYVDPAHLVPGVFLFEGGIGAQFSISNGDYRVFGLLLGETKYQSEPLFVNNTWCHFAIVRQAGTITCYKDGVAFLNAQDAYDISATNGRLRLGHTFPNEVPAEYVFEGSITNFRWTRGQAVYLADFAPPFYDLSALKGTTVLLLAKDAASVLENSPGTPGVFVTNNGVTWSGDVPTKTPSPDAITGSIGFSAANPLDPSIGTGIIVSQTDGSLSFGMGDFTVEWWQYDITSTTQHTIFSFAGEDGYSQFGASTVLQSPSQPGDPVRSIGIGANGYFWSDKLLIGLRWCHFAAVRVSGQLHIYFNGVEQASIDFPVDLAGAGSLSIGTESMPGNPTPLRYSFEGYLANFRWTKGTAVYTSNFVPTTNNLPALKTTSVLLLAKNEENLITNSAETSTVTIENIQAQWSSSVPT